MVRSIGSVPGLRFIGEFPLAYIRRVPGLDVALGVTAYQVASMVQGAVSAAQRGGNTAVGIAARVNGAVAGLVKQADEAKDVGADLALYTAKGAMNALDGVGAEAGEMARGTVLGVIRGVGRTSGDILDTVRSAAQGTVQGASESGADIGEIAQVATQAVEASRTAAQEMGFSEDAAANRAAQGAIAAAEALGPEVASRVIEALLENEPPLC
jgi:hypothetical protein